MCQVRLFRCFDLLMKCERIIKVHFISQNDEQFTLILSFEVVFLQSFGINTCSIFHEYEVWIEISVSRDHCSALLGCVMPNSDPSDEVFLSTSHIHDRYFFLHSFLVTTFDFKRRTRKVNSLAF